eukprot:3235074-Karenia_brevis.AAC.1
MDDETTLGSSRSHHFVMMTHEERQVDVLQISQHEWSHLVRDAIRVALWRRAASRRADMKGIEHGIDRYATNSLLSDIASS